MGDFVARENIPVGGVLAYTRGQRVTAQAVKDNGWDDLVVGENTKEARQIAADITGQSAEDDTKATSTSRTVSAATGTEQKG